MTAAYEVWRGAMYCVGVFVTCNVGGMALRWGCDRVSGLMNLQAVTDDAEGDANRKRHPFDDCPFDEMSRYSEEEPDHAEVALVSTPRSDRQRFEDMQRQIKDDVNAG